MESLTEVTTERAEGERLRRVLDTLGDDGDAEGLAEPDDRAHDRSARSIGTEPGDEARVDLELVDAEGGHVRQRRAPGAVVVQRHADAETFECVERRARGADVDQDASLRDLDHEPGGI